VRLDGDIDAAYRQATWKIEELVGRLAQPLTALPYRRDGDSASATQREVCSNMAREEYEAKVKRIKEYIVDGDCIQVVFSQRFSRPTPAHAFDIYRALRTVNPSPYMFYLDLAGCQVVGASPEMLVRVEGRHVELHPIAGSRPRGADEAEDAVLLEALNSSEQVRAEHAELVGQVRRDVARVCEYGTVRVPRYMEVDRYSHVMQMVSTVEGQLDPGHDRFDALAACMPGGSVTGVPKRRAMQVIDDLEPDGRGIYAGAIGYLDVAGNLDFCTAIRTIAIRDGRASMQAGAPIGAETDPDDAFRETSAKTEALRRALVRAHDLT
jgi:anthranilate synthase component 1